MRRIPPEQRRAQLIEAAIRVIARDGLDAATTRTIVAEAGMPLGALHYVFASRDDLIDAVVEQVIDEARRAAVVQADADDAAVDIETLTRRQLEAYLRLLESEPNRELALLEVSVHSIRRNRAAAHRHWESYQAAVVETLRHAARRAGITWNQPEERIAHLLIRAIDGLTLSWLTDRDSAAARDYIDFVASSFAAFALPVAPPARTGGRAAARSATGSRARPGARSTARATGKEAGRVH
jgi:AcrR family transcriptional regulator